MRYLDVTRGLNHIGRLGENEHRTLRFGETAADLAMYPDATVAVIHRRYGDDVGYPVPPSQITIQDGVVCWMIASSDLGVKGRGKVEVILYQGTVIAKSYIFDTMVDDALDGSGENPDPVRSFVQDVTELTERAEAAAELLEHPEAVAETLAPGSPATAAYSGGTFTFGIPEGQKGDKGDTGATGPQGPQGIQGVQGPQGIQGPKGDPGEDYVITSADYDEIAGEVATRRAIQGKVDAAKDAADLARGYAEGKHLDGTDNTSLIGNNANYHAEQAKKWADGEDASGDPVESTEPQYQDSAKYWAGQAADTAGMLGDVALDSTAQKFVQLVDDNSILTEEMFDLMIDMLPGDDSGQLILQDLVDENSNLDLLVRELLEREATA